MDGRNSRLSSGKQTKRMTADEFGDFVEQSYDEIENLPENYSKAESRLSIMRQIFNESRKAYIDEREKQLYKEEYLKQLLETGLSEKGEWGKSGSEAIKCFIRALDLDPCIPIAHYRLGHIHFKKRNMPQAVHHFYESIQMQEMEGLNKKFHLDSIQVLTAKKMTSFAALRIFEELRDDALEHERYPELDALLGRYIAHEEIESDYTKDVKMKVYGDQAYQLIDQREYEEWLENTDVLIIDRCSSSNSICYNAKNKELSPDMSGFLIDILDGKVDEPGISLSTRAFYTQRANTNRKMILRLKDKMKELGLNEEQFGLEFAVRDQKQEVSFEPRVKTIVFRRLHD